MVTIDQLFVYPIKSFPGISVNRLEFTTSGPRNDREFMLVDERLRMITQRTHPLLSQFTISTASNGWQVTAPDGSTLTIAPNEVSEAPAMQSKVWQSAIQVREASVTASQWFSQHLDQLVRLVEFDDLESRHIDVQGHSSALQFADKYPLLICNQKSLERLAQQVGQSLEMARFRPNIVISIEAESEYLLTRLEKQSGGKLLIGDACERCNIPAIDPNTGVFNKALHITMRSLLKRDQRTIFGINASAFQLSHIEVGDVFQPICLVDDADKSVFPDLSKV